MNSTMDGLDESRSRSFVNLWPVAEAYQVIDGYVCALVGGKVTKPNTLHTHVDCRRYLPMAHPEIPSAFAKAATGKASDILTFVHHYGLVGYDRAWRIPDELMGVRTLLPGQHDLAALQHGDPFTWVVAHARTVKLLLDLIGTLDDPAAIQRAIDELRVRHSSPNGTHEESHRLPRGRAGLPLSITHTGDPHAAAPCRAVHRVDRPGEKPHRRLPHPLH